MINHANSKNDLIFQGFANDTAFSACGWVGRVTVLSACAWVGRVTVLFIFGWVGRVTVFAQFVHLQGVG